MQEERLGGQLALLSSRQREELVEVTGMYMELAEELEEAEEDERAEIVRGDLEGGSVFCMEDTLVVCLRGWSFVWQG